MARGKKTGGRTKGTPNVITREVREVLKDIISYEMENVPEYLSQLDPKDKLDIIIKLLPFAIPKAESAIDDEEWPEVIETTLKID